VFPLLFLRQREERSDDMVCGDGSEVVEVADIVIPI
jgi:hypothetical protein